MRSLSRALHIIQSLILVDGVFTRPFTPHLLVYSLLPPWHGRRQSNSSYSAPIFHTSRGLVRAGLFKIFILFFIRDGRPPVTLWQRKVPRGGSQARQGLVSFLFDKCSGLTYRRESNNGLQTTVATHRRSNKAAVLLHRLQRLLRCQWCPLYPPVTATTMTMRAVVIPRPPRRRRRRRRHHRRRRLSQRAVSACSTS